MKILVLIAHPDDEVIMCGATIDKLVKNGHRVYVTYYTLNDQAYFKNETQSMRRRRTMKEAIRSSQHLGYNVCFLIFQDMQLEKDKGLLIQTTIKEIRRIKPDIVITHHAEDKHIDHRTLGEIVPEANFQSGCALCGGQQTWKAPVVLQGEIDLEMTSSFNFHVVSAVSEENLKRKIESFILYESVKKTSRLVLVHEDTFTGGWSAEIAARTSEEMFNYLDAPVRRVCAPDTPLPFSPPMENFYIPSKENIKKAVESVL